ncbi:hypothetical protein C8R43DRAFT_986310 [Mycena crocata]|nr:hypothetical protein C8R43DRAFT_986310 [Mycena crocata]
MNMPMPMPTAPPPPRVSPTMSQPRVAFLPSEASSTTVVDSEPRWRDSYASNTRNVPVSQLVQIDDHHPADDTGAREAGRARVLSDPGRYEELRGLNMMGDRQREAYVNAFAPGTQPRILQWPMLPEIPAVVRSDSDSSSRGVPPPERARRTSSGNLWSSLPQLPSQRSSPQAQPRPPSTPPLPRLDTSRLSAPIPPPEPRWVENQARQQSPPRRDTPAVQQPPSTAPPVSSNRSRTPLAGPRVLPAEPQRRRSDGDQPMNASPSLLKRTSAIFHKGRTSPEPAAPRPTRPGALPLDPQRRRSDGFQSVVPPRPTTPGPSNAVPRNVRWNENLVCPSPVFANQRRKGWFNRRGDQLWTNDGAYKPPPAGQEFPPDLRDYPVYGSGWMNEEGVRIDMGHRLIPKAPLRSALKQTQARGPVIQVDHGN